MCTKTSCWVFRSTALHLVLLLLLQEATLEPGAEPIHLEDGGRLLAIISVLSNEHRSHCLANRHWGSHWEISLETLKQIGMYQIRELKITAIACAFSVSISCSHPLVLLSLRCYFCHIAAGRVRTCTEADAGSNWQSLKVKPQNYHSLYSKTGRNGNEEAFLFFLVSASSTCSTNTQKVAFSSCCMVV